MTPEDRKLMQQLRDALEDFADCGVTGGWKGARARNVIAAADARLAAPEWIAVSDALPEPGVSVIAFVPHFGDGKYSRLIRAQYVAKHSLEQHIDAEGGDYDEASDTYYCEPGWYDENEHEEIHWRVSDDVTHWQHLPTPPEAP